MSYMKFQDWLIKEGKVGIGVANPATYTLQVADDMGIGSYAMMKSSATYMGMIA